MDKIVLSLTEWALARHALGLPGKARRSYRNRFVTDRAGDDGVLWMAMVARGAARVRQGSALTGGDDFFWLTREGAEAALLPGESLCAEDFPDLVTGVA